MDIPNSGAVFTLGKSHLAENTQSYFYIKNDPVQRLISGPRQSAVICESGRLFVWGENHYGQLGIGSSKNNNNASSDIITKPTCVKSLKTLGLKIADIAFGNDWAVMLSHSNELFFAGRSIFAADANVARNFSSATVAGEQCAVIRKPFRLEELDDCLAKTEEAESYVAVLAGNEHFAAMTSFGRLIAWGSNQSHQLGLASGAVIQRPHEIKLDAPMQQFVCGPESTLVLTTSGKLYFTGRLNEFVFPQFTELQQNLSPTEQIIFMHISRTNDIYIVTNAGSIYRSLESVRSKSLIFQRFYDYDSEENGPIWKLLKGFSFYAVLTKANKFYTTFSESGHHLKTFREISKFKNLRLLDMAVGEQHVLVHGIPRSSTLSATVGPLGSGEAHRFMSRTFVMQAAEAVGAVSGRGRSGGLSATKRQPPEDRGPAAEEQSDSVTDENSNTYAASAPDHVETPKSSTQKHEKGNENTPQKAEVKNGLEQREPKENGNLKDAESEPSSSELSNHLVKDASNGSLQSIVENGRSVNDEDEEQGKRAERVAPAVAITTNGPKSPTESMKSRRSVRSVKNEAAAVERNSSPAEKLLRPRTPYPENSTTGSTPQIHKKTPLRNYSYEAAMDHDYLERTSPVLMDSLENIPENVESRTAGTGDSGKGKGKGRGAVPTAASIRAMVSSPTPPPEEDEQLTVEINTTTDELDRTVVVNEIRFINNGVDVTANVKERTLDTEDDSIADSLDEHFAEISEETSGVMQKIEQHVEAQVDSAVEVKNEVEAEAKNAAQQIVDKAEAELSETRDSMDTVTEKAIIVATDVRDTVETAAKKVTTTAADTRESVETVAKKTVAAVSDMRGSVETTVKKAAADARDAVDTVGENAKRMGSDTKQTVESIGSSAIKVATGAKNAVGNVFIKMSDGTKEAVDTVAAKIANEVQGAKENISSLLGSKQAKPTVTEEADDVSLNSKEDGAKTNTTTGEDDERTTASVNSTETSTGNPFEAGNPFESGNAFEHEVGSVIGRGKKALREDINAVEEHIEHEAGRSKGKVRQFFSDIREKGKGISCRNEKSVRIADEPPQYSVEDQFSTPVRRSQQNNTSKVCSIL